MESACQKINQIRSEKAKISVEVEMLREDTEDRIAKLLESDRVFNPNNQIEANYLKLRELNNRLVDLEELEKKVQELGDLQDLKKAKAKVKEGITEISNKIGRLNHELADKRKSLSSEEEKIIEIYGLAVHKELGGIIGKIREMEAMVLEKMRELRDVEIKIREIYGED